AGDSVDVEMEFPVSLDFALPDVQRVLLLSRALIEPQGGRLAISQGEQPLLRIKLCWPADPGGA
ncbi:MAG: hypothetical protein OEY03_02520, partial [Rhizobacter sp.]|nr:hypothetical protein [Rhizobacter sp.]